MMAALGTLTFLVTQWLLVVIGAMVLEESGAKIAAALKGNSLRGNSQRQPVRISVRIRVRQRLRPMLRAKAEWRAAA